MGHDVKHIKAQAHGRWTQILPAFGCGHEYLTGNHGPCPHCGGNDRFRYDDKNGDGDWYCNKCGGQGDGGAGDGFQLVQRLHGWDLNTAINEVASWLGTPDPANDNRPRHEAPPPPKPAPSSSRWQAIAPVPADARPLIQADGKITVWNPKKAARDAGYKGSTFKPALLSEYRTAAGELVGYVARIQFDDGQKITPQICYAKNTVTGEHAWVMQGMPEPRPLLGAHEIGSRENVLIVEGEKTREAAKRLVGGMLAVVTWAGGSKGIRLADWSPLAGKKVIIWPDHDLDGARAAHGYVHRGEAKPGIADLAVKAGAAGVRVVMPPADQPEGWDLADAEQQGWTGQQVIDWIRGNLAEPHRLPEQREDKPTTQPAKEQRPVDPPAKKPSGGLYDFVQPLGFNRGEFFYMSRDLRQVTALTAGAHTKNNLLGMAAMDVWKSFFPAKSEFDAVAAADWLMEACRLRGIYDPGRVRGRGCWSDDGRTVLHLGDRLLVDGAEIDPREIGSRYVYEACARIEGPDADTLTPEERRLILELAKSFRWEIAGSAMLLVGWVVLAPICGALQWRPHIWLAGGSGSGKTTIQDDFITPLLAGMARYFQGNSTEAGIRQTLQSDALPVVLDETEQNDQREQQRVQSILALARQASSDSGATTVKGGAQGDALSFHVRSMFAFASIQVGIKMQADTTRIAVLGLRSADSSAGDKSESEGWQRLQAQLARITPETGRRLFRRTVDMAPTIGKAIEVFKRAAAEHFGSQRLGDTYGTLLAGAWSLLSDRVPTEQDAHGLINRCDWTPYTEAASENEADAALSSIMQVQVRVDGHNMAETLTIGELLDHANGVGTVNVTSEVARRHLARYGVKLDDGKLLVANKSDLLARALADKPWGVDWKGYLRRISGALPTGNVKFATGLQSRATALPLDKVIKG